MSARRTSVNRQCSGGCAAVRCCNTTGCDVHAARDAGENCRYGIDPKPRATIPGPQEYNSGTGSFRNTPRALNSRFETFESRSLITRSTELEPGSEQFHGRCEEPNGPFEDPNGAFNIPACLRETRFRSFRISPKQCRRFQSQTGWFRGSKTGLDCAVSGFESATRNAHFLSITHDQDWRSRPVFANARAPPAERRVCSGRGFTRFA
jgi:hypothetical protein